MEGLLSVPLKRASEGLDLVKPLKTIIAGLYSSPERQAEFLNSITEFNKLRSYAVAKQNERSQSVLEALYKYHDQIASIELKIPSQDLQVNFKWRDAFDKGGMFGGKVSLTVPSLGYEKVCILFNIAAMQSQLASASRVSDTDEELKNAAKLFQSAAGIFAQLRNAAGVMGGHEPTADLSPQALSVLSVLMLAQAQEVFVYKAIQDKMKDAIIAKLAMQAEDLYAETLHTMQKETRVYWDKEWLSTIAGKQAAFVGLANCFQSNVCASKKQIGEQIGRLNLCLEQLKQAQTRSGIANLFADYVGKATRSLAEAKKDNDFIYHERVPESMAPVEKVGTARLAKPTPVPTKFHTGRDLFEDLVPVPVHHAMQACDMRKAEIVNARVGQLREGSQLLNSILVSLNLPAAIEDQGASNSIPQSLLEKSRAVQEQGGVRKLEATINELPELVQRNKEILDETERLLTEEEQSDEQLRSQLKEKWTRTASASLNASFKQNLSKYRTIINNALSADQIVKSKLAAHHDAMEVLSAGESALASRLPQSSSARSGTGSASAKENLKRLMREVETMKAERADLESKLKTVTFDFKTQFLQALAQDGVINEPALSLELLGHGFATYDAAVKEQLGRQQELLAEIQANSDEYFGRQQNTDQVDANSRDSVMRQLAEGFDAFSELQSNIKEGTKFYNDLTQLLLTYQNKVTDFCFARKTEKEELLKDVTRTASASNATQPPPRPPQPIIPTTPYAGPAQPLPYAPAQPQQPAVPPQPLAAAAQQQQQQQQQQWYGTYPPYPNYQPQGMPMPFQQQATPYPFTPMPGAYNPYGAYAPIPQQQQPGQPQNYPYPVQPTMQQYPPPYTQQQPHQ